MDISGQRNIIILSRQELQGQQSAITNLVSIGRGLKKSIVLDLGERKMLSNKRPAPLERICRGAVKIRTEIIKRRLIY